jgi:hypothetical protein
MTESDQLVKAKKLLKQIMGNYKTANQIAENEGFETNYQQDQVLVDFLLSEPSSTDIDIADAQEQAALTGESYMRITCNSSPRETPRLRYEHLNKELVTITPTAI